MFPSLHLSHEKSIMTRASNVFILLFLLLSGGRAFVIHSTHHSLCLEDSPSGQVLLKRCSLDSEDQQWVWTSEGQLMCVGSARCLSAEQQDSVKSSSCEGPEGEAAGLLWDCDRDRLISRDTSLLLSTDGHRLTLNRHGQHSRWRSVDEGDICQEKLRPRRSSDDPDDFQVADDKAAGVNNLTEEQKAYLRWFYRTEDPSVWKYVLLGVAFVCLLIGFLLLGMGAMANKNRKKIAQYKAAAAGSLIRKNGGEELQMVSPLKEEGNGKPPSSPNMQGSKSFSTNGDVDQLGAGSIKITWKDGNTSCLYPDPEAEAQEEVEEEKQEVVVSLAETHAYDEAKTME